MIYVILIVENLKRIAAEIKVKADSKEEAASKLSLDIYTEDEWRESTNNLAFEDNLYQ